MPERQRKANRNISGRGGPNPAEGQQRRRVKSMKHGITSSTFVIPPEEDNQECEEVLGGFETVLTRKVRSKTPALVRRLAQTHWRGLHSRRLETRMLYVTAGHQRTLRRQTIEGCA